jgi:hypothetical protein
MVFCLGLFVVIGVIDRIDFWSSRCSRFLVGKKRGELQSLKVLILD